MNICQLSDEIFVNIFVRLDALALSRCCQVCKLFKRIAEDERFWKALFPQFSPPPDLRMKEYLPRISLFKLKKIKNYSWDILDGERGRLKLMFVHNPGMKMECSFDFAHTLPPSRRPAQKIVEYVILEKFPTDSDQTYYRFSFSTIQMQEGRWDITLRGDSSEIASIETMGAFLTKTFIRKAVQRESDSFCYFSAALVAIISALFQACLNASR